MPNEQYFTKGFGDYACHGDSIECEVGGITYTARLAADTNTRVEDFDCYAPEAIEAWKRDEWHYFGVVIDAGIVGWERLHVASLWGCEGNFPGSEGNGRLTEIANELMEEAIPAVKESLAEVAAIAALATAETGEVDVIDIAEGGDGKVYSL